MEIQLSSPSCACLQVNRLAGIAVCLHCLLPPTWVPPLSTPSLSPVLPDGAGKSKSNANALTLFLTFISWRHHAFSLAPPWHNFVFHSRLSSCCKIFRAFAWSAHRKILPASAMPLQLASAPIYIPFSEEIFMVPSHHPQAFKSRSAS